MHDPYNAFLDFDDNAIFGDGPLADVTIGVKANIAVKGLPFHAGLAGLTNRIAERDAQTVTALRNTGAKIIGTVNMEEGAFGSKSDNPHFGAVQNPWQKGYSPGGSSGGSGAAVAGGLCDAALGSDTMGSVRIPSAHCGVYGFKPATDRVSQDGLEPADSNLDAIGPLARDLDMLERVARTMSDFGESEIDGEGAILLGHGVTNHPAVAEAWCSAQQALGNGVAEHQIRHLNSRIRYAGFIQVSKAMAEHLADVPDKSAHLEKLLTYGPARSVEDWAEDQRVLDTTHDEVRGIVARHGFLLLPTVPNPPFPHSEREPAAQADFTCLANIAGLPAISIPAGWTNDGLPVGMQIIGQTGAEAGLFALARRLDKQLGAYRAPPKERDQCG